MRTVTVPAMVCNASFNKEAVLSELKRAKADTVLLAVCRSISDRIHPGKDVEVLSELIPYFRKEGFSVGVWIASTIGHGAANYPDCRYTRFMTFMGHEATGCFCPEDEDFKADLCDWIRAVGKKKPDYIILDDDFRMSIHEHWSTSGCLCDKHIRLYNEAVGETLTREEIAEKAFNGTTSRYRDAYLDLMGGSLYRLAEAMRAALDEVAPEVRMGFCSVFTTWDADGTDVRKLSQALAGNTRPIFRTIGAPYWLANHAYVRSLGDIIDLERMELHYLKDFDADVMVEGDTYPRPRTVTPASYLEGFDTALIAAGNRGILKYMLTYENDPLYETGYIDAHEDNLKNYEAIDSFFSGKEACGVSVFEAEHKVRSMRLTGNHVNEMENSFFTAATRILTHSSIPLTFNESDFTCVFSESARYIPLSSLKRGGIIDVRAAEILAERGIDTGLIRDNGIRQANKEFFPSKNQTVRYPAFAAHDLTVSENVVPLSVLSFLDAPASGELAHLKFGSETNEKTGSYRYTNKDGQTFIVIALATPSDSDFHGYLRQEVLAETLSEIITLPAISLGHPDLYIYAAGGGDTLTVGCWNFFRDKITSPKITLDKAYTSIRSIDGKARISGNTVTLDTLYPYEFACFEVTL